MKKGLRGFAAGFLTAAILSATVFTVIAAPVEKTITALYGNIRVYVDGKLLAPKDANGNPAEPFIYNGTAYLPARAISEALGKTVSWDGMNNSVYIGQRPAQEMSEVTVATAEEFINAIGSNRKILLKPGRYDLSGIKHIDSQDGTVTWKQVQDGQELNISNVSNLTIAGAGGAATEIRVDPRYAFVMKFNNARNITIKNIVAGHTPEEYKCDAGVLGFEDSSNIAIDGSELYGCGSVGLSLRGVEKLNFTNSNINHCSLRAVDISNSDSVKFSGSKIVNNEAYSNIIYIVESGSIVFEECEIGNNNNFGWSFLETYGKADVLLDRCKIFNNTQTTDLQKKSDKVYFFRTLDSLGRGGGRIVVRDSELSDNRSDYLVNSEAAVSFENCTMSSSWGK